jgi:hypothetical protein
VAHWFRIRGHASVNLNVDLLFVFCLKAGSNGAAIRKEGGQDFATETIR